MLNGQKILAQILTHDEMMDEADEEVLLYEVIHDEVNILQHQQILEILIIIQMKIIQKIFPTLIDLLLKIELRQWIV
jgi:uncharacterized protein YfeS